MADLDSTTEAVLEVLAEFCLGVTLDAVELAEAKNRLASKFDASWEER